MLDAVIVGRVIQQFREERGVSQEVMSGLAGIGRTHLSAIERGERRPTMDTFFKICEAMNVCPSTVMAKIEEELKDNESGKGWMLWHNEKTEGCGVTMAPFTSPRGLALRRKWRQETNLYCLFLLHSAITSTLATPSALTRHCLATARSRRGSDMPPACHSLPRRRFAA